MAGHPARDMPVGTAGRTQQCLRPRNPEFVVQLLRVHPRMLRVAADSHLGEVTRPEPL